MTDSLTRNTEYNVEEPQNVRPLNDREWATNKIVTALMYAKRAEFDGKVPQFTQTFYNSGWTVTITNIPDED